MSSFLGKFKSSNDAKHNATGTSPAKKDPNAPQPTPLERMLENAGPIRNDGSDKFFGMENFGNTCYCNSILQCLYYTPPFRENVLSYPQRSTPDSLAAAAATVLPRPPYRLQNGVLVKPGQPVPPQPAKPVLTPAQQPGQKLEDKDSPEHKKKLALVAGPILNMTYQNATSYDMPESMFTSLKDIFEAVVAQQTRNGIVSPGRFLDVLRRDNEMFRSAMHQDAHEFLNLLLNSVIESIEDKERQQEAGQKAENANGDVVTQTESSAVSWPSTLPLPAAPSHSKWLKDMFEGTLTSETRCLACETVSHRDEPFLDLSVDLEQHSSVTSCLNRFSEEEMLCERNKFHCDNCGGLQEAEKRMKLKRLPKILALHLKRFKYTEDLARLQKLFHKVVYPYHLRLFHTTDDAEDPDRLYELYAVVVHIGGGPYHGHYVSIIKTQDRGWLLFDDEMVEPVDRSYVKNFFGDKAGLACAYVLFYRVTTEEDVRREQMMDGQRRSSQDQARDAAMNKDSAELHRIYSSSPPVSPVEASHFANLDHTLTAPKAAMNGHLEHSITSSPVVTGLSKKEKAKEEKERKAADKAAEKERERMEKARRKENDLKMKESQRKQAEELRTTLETSKRKAEEVKRQHPTEDGDKETHTNGFTSSFFGRSKSLRISSLGRREKASPMTQHSASEESSSALTGSPPTTSNPSVIDEQDEKDANTNGGDALPEKEKDKEKKSRFSIRKKSFGILG